MTDDIACAAGRMPIAAQFVRRLAAVLLLCSTTLALAGCGAPPPGSNDPDTHPGAALVPGGGAGPGLHGPFHSDPGPGGFQS